MDTEECIKARSEVRDYKTKPIKQDVLESILEAGTQAPSAGNIQDWRFIVVRDQNTKEMLTDVAFNQSFISKAAAAVVVCTDLDSITGAYGVRGSSLYAIQDTAAAIQNMVLAAPPQEYVPSAP